MKKRGSVDVPMQSVFIMVGWGIMALVGLVVLIGATNLIIQNNIDSGTEKTYEAFLSKIDELDCRDCDGKDSQVVYLGDDDYLVGFNKDQDSIIVDGKGAQHKPEKCGFGPCICVCSGDNDQVCTGEDTELVLCKAVSQTFNIDNFVVVSDSINQNKGQSFENGEYFFVDGAHVIENENDDGYVYLLEFEKKNTNLLISVT